MKIQLKFANTEQLTWNSCLMNTKNTEEQFTIEPGLNKMENMSYLAVVISARYSTKNLQQKKKHCFLGSSSTLGKEQEATSPYRGKLVNNMKACSVEGRWSCFL